MRAFVMPLKCLMVINDLARAGAEKQAVLLARGLKGLGWSVSIVVIKRRNDFAEWLDAASIPVTSLDRQGPWDLSVILRLRRAIADASPDVVLSFLFLANLLTVLATRGQPHRPAIVLSVRASYRSTLTRAQRLVARLAHRGAELVLFNSKESMREAAGARPRASRVAHLPNAVQPAAARPIQWSDFGVGAGPVVLSVGQLVAVKGHRLLVEAMADPRASRARLVLIGDGPEQRSLQSLAAARGIADRVTFLGHQPDPLPFMASADVFVQPSLTEGMSNALLEAMAAGRCIVATSVGAAPDLIEDGVQGLLSALNAADLATAMGRALSDPALRHRLGEGARARAEAFSIDRVASDLDRLLRDLLRDFPPPRGTTVRGTAAPRA